MKSSSSKPSSFMIIIITTITTVAIVTIVFIIIFILVTKEHQNKFLYICFRCPCSCQPSHTQHVFHSLCWCYAEWQVTRGLAFPALCFSTRLLWMDSGCLPSLGKRLKVGCCRSNVCNICYAVHEN